MGVTHAGLDVVVVTSHDRSAAYGTLAPQRPRTRRGHGPDLIPCGGRPLSFDAATYKSRNVVERSFNDHKHWRGLATPATTNSPPSSAARLPYAP